MRRVYRCAAVGAHVAPAAVLIGRQPTESLLRAGTPIRQPTAAQLYAAQNLATRYTPADEPFGQILVSDLNMYHTLCRTYSCVT